MPDVDRAYRILKEELGEAFEMVYVSGDRSPLDFRRYFEKMAWFALPYAPALRRSDLKRIFHVERIPKVVFLEWSGHAYTWSDIDGHEMFRSSEITIREYAGSIRIHGSDWSNSDEEEEDEYADDDDDREQRWG